MEIYQTCVYWDGFLLILIRVPLVMPTSRGTFSVGPLSHLSAGRRQWCRVGNTEDYLLRTAKDSSVVIVAWESFSKCWKIPEWNAINTTNIINATIKQVFLAKINQKQNFAGKLSDLSNLTKNTGGSVCQWCMLCVGLYETWGVDESAHWMNHWIPEGKLTLELLHYYKDQI